MNWNSESNIITEDIVDHVESILKVDFPEDFLCIIKKYDGGYPTPNKITINGNIEVVNNLVSFLEDDESFILDIFEETEYLKSTHLIPIAEDPFGNLFCYDFQDEEKRIVFWNHEDTDVSQFVCATFTEFVGMLHE
ncbi:MAG: SMI1/KNR4 family protein [Clostridiales bacterium]|nr:SMI1/KNR4 family protein [Clostridiales bacterium]